MLIIKQVPVKHRNQAYNLLCWCNQRCVFFILHMTRIEREKKLFTISHMVLNVFLLYIYQCKSFCVRFSIVNTILMFIFFSPSLFSSLSLYVCMCHRCPIEQKSPFGKSNIQNVVINAIGFCINCFECLLLFSSIFFFPISFVFLQFIYRLKWEKERQKYHQTINHNHFIALFQSISFFSIFGTINI